jgi:hypothetical protein
VIRFLLVAIALELGIPEADEADSGVLFDAITTILAAKAAERSTP